MLSIEQFERAQAWPRSDRVRLFFDLDPFDYQADVLDDPARQLASLFCSTAEPALPTDGVTGVLMYSGVSSGNEELSVTC